MKQFAKYLMLLLLPFLVACGEQESPEKRIAKKWDYAALSNGQTGGSINLIYKDNAPNPFVQITANGEDTLRGTWTLQDSKINLSYPMENMSVSVDSALFVSENGKPKLTFMSEGRELADFMDGTALPRETVKVITVDSLSDQSALFGADGRSNLVTYTPTVIESQMSFTSIMRGLLGILVLLVIAWLFSANRKAINWMLVVKGLAFQILFAILILKVPFVASIFEAISHGFLEVIDYAQAGAQFLFAQFGMDAIQPPLINFVFTVLPTIVFFSALTSMLYYFGILQRVVYVLAWVMKFVMKLSGAEALAAAGNVFLGQTEAPLLIKPYLKTMTKSEIMCLMSGGMATIAGGVLAAYITFLGGDDPEQQLFFAKHLLAASVMSAPAAIVAAKIIVPETEEFNAKLKITKDKIGTNVLEAISNGTTDGLKLAVNVAAMLLVFISIMAMGNGLLGWIGSIGGENGLNAMIAASGHEGGLSFQYILGNIFAPLSWTLGVPTEDIFAVGQLLGEKTILNEFYAYTTLGDMKASGTIVHEKSIVMATYVLCGFANFASIGIQIGGIGSLVPERKALLAKLGARSLVAGTLACLFTAVIVGMLM